MDGILENILFLFGNPNVLIKIKCRLIMPPFELIKCVNISITNLIDSFSSHTS